MVVHFGCGGRPLQGCVCVRLPIRMSGIQTHGPLRVYVWYSIGPLRINVSYVVGSLIQARPQTGQVEQAAVY